MESDCYQVEVLHYINPHLIWVELKNISDTQTIVLEQIGIYGILPLAPSVEVVTDELYFERCFPWTPTACILMQKVLDRATEVWFIPTYIDRRTSILDNNLHKFGEILIKTPDEKFRKLSRYLTKSSSAMENEFLFHHHLSLGNIKTKLSIQEFKEVIRELEKYYETKSTFNQSKRNIECIKNQTSLFQKKLHPEAALTMENLEKHNSININYGVVGTTEILNTVKQNLESNALEMCYNFNNSKNDYNSSLKSENESSLINVHKSLLKKEQTKHLKENKDEDNIKAEKSSGADKVREKFVAIGPAGLNISKFHTKSNPVKFYEKSQNISDKEENILDDVDLNTDIEITNRDLLKTHLKSHFNIEENKTKALLNKNPNAHKDDNKDFDTNEFEEEILSSVINIKTVHSEPSDGRLEKILNASKTYHNRKRSDLDKDSSFGSITNVKKDEGSDDEKIDEIEKLSKQFALETPLKVTESEEMIHNHSKLVNFVNSFSNFHPSYSGFVDKIKTPVLMVHTKNNNRIEPRFQLREMSVQSPITLQSVSWSTILRGYSLFMISPSNRENTLDYLPAVCRHISDGVDDDGNVGPACIILCATANSVSNIEHLCKIFLSAEKKVLACYAGVEDLKLTTFLLNGCDLFVCTPPSFMRLTQLTDFGVYLRRLSTVVFDDCERLAIVYSDELKIFLFKIKEMLKHRANKEWKVQYILASTVWCDFMEPLAKKDPNTVICIGAPQECVLYSKAKTQVSFVDKNNKIDAVLDFLKKNDISKKTVIVCHFDDEVPVLEKVLSKKKYIVLACNNSMTVEELYKMNIVWNEYQEPLTRPILVCCDGSLTHMNVTDAHYLVHFSLPHLFSMFCERFSVLNDNHASIFKPDNEHVEVKILLEEDNIEQLPKILHFIKRCTDHVPPVLDEICEKVLAEKDADKAKGLVPICGNLLTLGECPDFWNCQERHAVLKEYDEPKDWMPKNGVITFKILHYHSAVSYSAKLLTNIVNGATKKYPQTYGALSLKMEMYYSKERNRKQHGIPKVGDICAVSIRHDFFARCQVVKVINRYQNSNPNNLLIKLLDEEKFDTTKDIYLYDLPNELKELQTHLIQVQLANVHPKDKDVTFSNLARDHLQKITHSEETFYIQGNVVITVGKCVFVDTLEVCQDLTSLNETVVRYDLKKELLDTHGLLNQDHIQKLVELCKELEACRDLNEKYESRESSDPIQIEELDEMCEDEVDKENKFQESLSLENVERGNGDLENVCSISSDSSLTTRSYLKTKLETSVSTLKSTFEEVPNRQNEKNGVWAQLDEDMSAVYFTSAENPDKFFVRLAKFSDSIDVLLKDIQDYVNNEKPEPVKEINEGDIVIARFPGDSMYERARIEEVYTDKVKCFYADHGDLRDLPKEYVIPIPNQFLTALPFQAIECRLIGVKPAGEQWTEFSTNWFCDRFYEEMQVYVKYFTRMSAVHTEGYRYGVAIIDTNSDQDVVINQLLIDLNLAKENEEEVVYLSEFNVNMNFESAQENSDDNFRGSEEDIVDADERSILPLGNLFPKQPIRSMSLVPSDDDSDVSDKWDIHASEDFKIMFTPNNPVTNNLNTKPILPGIDNEIHENKNVLKQYTNSGVSNSISVPKLEEIKELDSDDLTSPDTTELSIKIDLETSKELTEGEQSKVIDQLRKPKILWRQNKKAVTLSIQLIGVEKYNLEIMVRSIKFSAVANEIEYGFDVDLYGIIDSKMCSHTNKGQYIRVNLVKLLENNWLTLLRDGGTRKWIVYDVDSIDTSSDEEDVQKEPLAKIVKNSHNKNCDSDDDDFSDDFDLRL